jgi:FtsP/CotA-like multicopper oxidase with cupredoxin domain
VVIAVVAAGLLSVTLVADVPAAEARINGLSGATTFNFTAKADHLSTGEGSVLLFWGIANGNGRAQYTAPTLILNQGDSVTIALTNELPVATSLVFPGQTHVSASGGTAGLLTREAAANGGTVTYTFLADHPGTYLYHSGTNPEIQVDMGLVGAIIVRPTGFDPLNPTAYGPPDTAYDNEVLYLMTEMDPRLHALVESQGVAALESTDYLSNPEPNYWFLNGRNAPDTMAGDGVAYLPVQPYSCMPMMHPGDKLLMRNIGGGKDLHPFHTHGNHFRLFAKDGRLLRTSDAAPISDLATYEYTHKAIPGETFDFIFEWTGEQLGWDIYGTGPGFHHTCTPDASGFDLVTKEYCPDHGKPIPVQLPPDFEVAIGSHWGGSPYLGHTAQMPPGAAGLNPMGGFTYMWHSHQERDMVNNDVFPGGMMTMLMVVAPGTHIH